MQFFNLLIVAALSLVTGDRVFFPKSSRVAVNWNQLDTPLDPNHKVNLRVALHPKDGKTLQQTLLNLSTPGSPVFRQWLKKDQITDIVGRSDADIAKINNYLSTQNLKVNSINPHRDWIFVDATVAQVEKIFQCKLAIFENKKTGGTRIVSTNGYSIPEEISDIVHIVAGLNTFSGSHWSAIDSRVDTAVAAQVTPDTIYTNYQAPKTGSHGSKKGSQAVVEFGKAANFNTDDLQTFFTNFQPSLVGETCGMAYGTNNGGAKPSVEANLDVQYIMAAGVYVNTTDYKMTEGGSIEDQMLDYAILVNSQNQPPLVHSISYGEYGGSYDNATDHQFDYELQKMGVSGITVLLASGDNGVGCNTAGTSLEFDYPDCPHITMVGATYIDSATKQEIGATLSSGGFSENFMMPDWQKTAVTAYLNSGVTLPSQYFQSAGRAYPDVAAYGQNVQVVASGNSEAVSGTSCSAPIFAGIIAAINDQLLTSGKPSMGFINPWIYAHPEVFTDITSGSNPYQRCDGFIATAGWDPVTGMGTPLYNKMLTAAQSGR